MSDDAVSPALANIREAAQFLNISPTMAWRFVHRGRIKSVRLGRAIRISWDELERVARDGIDYAQDHLTPHNYGRDDERA